MTPDPYKASGGPASPQSWNRYTYTRGDPVNRYDPAGLMDTAVCDFDGNEADCFGGGGDDDGGFCDASQEDCGDPCVSADGTPSPGPGCQTGGVFAPPPVSGGSGDSFVSPQDRDSTDAVNDLAKADCYQLLGFATAAAAQSWFRNHITFTDVHNGDLQVKGGVPQGPPAPAPSETNQIGLIFINIDYNWGDFSKVTTSTGSIYNYLAYLNKVYGSNMNSEQLGTFLILHELLHNRPSQFDPGEGVKAGQTIIKDCLK
jgi:hypothetical protein